MITSRTVLCGLIGDPVAHSLSPALHNAAFAHLGLDYAYLAFRVDSRNLDLALAGFRMLGGRGLNVTVPHKTAVMPFLDELDGEAEKIGAVNTIVFEAGRLKGYNTDAPGFSRTLEASGFEPRGKKVVVLGAGGAARAVAFALIDRVSQIIILTRRESLDKGWALVSRLGDKAAARELDDMTASLDGADLLVNATSAGMSPRLEETLVSPDLLRPGLTVFDVVYNPRETRLLRDARVAGCRVISGLEMLLYQGALSFELWTGQAAPIDIMRQAALGEQGMAATPHIEKNIALIGFMGSGKSAAGKALASRLGRRLVETDRLVEKSAGRSVGRIFAEEGEAAFRTLEVEAVKTAASARGAVISCGGGVVLNPENTARLKESSVVVYLKASPKALLARVGHSRRPLLRGGDRLSIITTLMGQRASLYEQAADIAIDTSNMGVAGVVDAIMAALSQP